MVLHKVDSLAEFSSQRDLIISSYMLLRGNPVSAADVDQILECNVFKNYSLDHLVDVYNCNSALGYVGECKQSSVYHMTYDMLFTLLQFVNKKLSVRESIIVGDQWVRNPHSLVSALTKLCSKHYTKPQNVNTVFRGMMEGLHKLQFLPPQIEDSFLYLIAQHTLLCFGNSVLLLGMDDSVDTWRSVMQEGLEDVYVS